MKATSHHGPRMVRLLLWLCCALLPALAFAAPHPQLPLLQSHLARYQEIERAGGWPTIKATKKFISKGDSGPAVTALRQRLQATGDLAADALGDTFDEALLAAVKRVQQRFGFTPSGVVDAALLKELNVPVSRRIAQLQANLERARSLPEPAAEGMHFIANVPEFKLHVYDNGRHAFDMNIVVGSESNKTVLFNDQMTHLVFSPSWNVPPSIVKNEILPAMRGRREYLWRHNYVIEGEEGGLPKIRQLPGPKNSLGRVKFVFPNDHNIYFHDTPAKSLFALRKRAFSHGCIRLAEPEKLAQYVLRNDPSWTAEKIHKAMYSGNEQRVNLAKPIPVSLTYLTAWVDGDGLLHFREDIYGLDS
ncbi:L,D-transpeptidase family protein [Flaviaesturariibacter amylovorans]|uniref:L,D-TPase catalytic domain-containing protein n=1 Tax=Flaviaesturariibacter amylovorans TaxID=1084520 RepID=A0ABP8HGI1_9BACT